VEEITANDGTRMKYKEINNMNKLILTYFINEFNSDSSKQYPS